ncbi:MAG: hypothetical protein C4527_08465 [Candidatus Omnitrophota bacterium]|nr:MAG: hypothetical protein C4527_08465 [Candidatus Omnitrophota bacterium]
MFVILEFNKVVLVLPASPGRNKRLVYHRFGRMNIRLIPQIQWDFLPRDGIKPFLGWRYYIIFSGKQR